jgi:hypothetical protein
MKKIVFFAAIMTISLGVFAQAAPTTWTITQNRVVDGSRNLIITADIHHDWYIYGMNMAEGGPLSLEFSIEDAETTVNSARFTEITPGAVMYDEIFEINVSSYTTQAQFKCNYVPKTGVQTLTLVIDGQACNKINGTCIQIIESIPITISE